MTPAIGDRFTAPWGRYEVHRVDADAVVLRDLDRPTACVTPTLVELATRYELVARAPVPAPSSATVEAPSDGRRRCPCCRQPARAFAIVVVADVELSYCWRCYGVSEQQQREATGALSTTWSPPPGEAYETRAEVGSFDPPPPGEQRPRPRTKRPEPRRIGPDDWLLATGEVRR